MAFGQVKATPAPAARAPGRSSDWWPRQTSLAFSPPARAGYLHGNEWRSGFPSAQCNAQAIHYPDVAAFPNQVIRVAPEKYRVISGRVANVPTSYAAAATFPASPTNFHHQPLASHIPATTLRRITNASVAVPLPPSSYARLSLYHER